MSKINFASDNYAGVHSSIINALARVNIGPAPAYGSDSATIEALEVFKKIFGANSETYFVWNGTAANVIGLMSAVRPHQGIICSDLAHIHMDECNAPEKHTGGKLILVPSTNGKISISAIKPYLVRRGDQHAVQPKVISISQVTEYGTLYSLKELRELADFAHQNGLYLHLDGARIANAAASLNCTFKEMTTDCGVDFLSFGGTKNGLMGAEAIVLLNPELQKDFQYIRKQGLHLASKMRFLSAQFLAYFENNLWETCASHANKMAQELANNVKKLHPGILITRPVEANSVFMILPTGVIKKLQEKFYFYVWNESTSEVRIMCSFQTTPDEVKAFIQALS